MLNKNKSSGFAKKIIIIIIAVAILAVISFISERKGYFSPESDSLSQEEILAKQVEELDRLRQEGSADPVTQEDIKKQAQELDKLRNNADALTQEQIQKQVEELNGMRIGQ